VRKTVKTWSTPVEHERRRQIPCALCGENVFKPALKCGDFSYVRCGNCGLVQINPQPFPSEIAARYGEAHGKDYLSYELNNEANFLRLQELALTDAGFFTLEKELLKNGNDPHVIDIGCATGTLLEKLRERGWNCTGVEISPSAEYAREKRGLDVRGTPLEECGFPDGSFDVLLASHLIEHLNDPALFVSEAYRVLGSGGRIYITTPNIAGFQARLFRGHWRSAIFDHLYLFSLRTLSRLLEKHGFVIEKRVTWGGLAAGTAPLPLKRIADRAAKRFGFGDVMLLRGRKIQPD
jgi:SAM-dependent methyltransferase